MVRDVKQDLGRLEAQHAGKIANREAMVALPERAAGSS
jgi:hypothetical protein